MKHQKIFDYTNKVLDFGYTYLPRVDSKITLEAILDTVQESIIVADTKGMVIDSLLSKSTSILVDKSRMFIGLVSYGILKSLKTKGINSGFFRSTTLSFEVAIIIVNKVDTYVCLDDKHIYALESKTNEIFNFINHLIWANADAEYVSGSFKVIKESNLTVPAPVIVNGVDYSKAKLSKHRFGTLDFDHEVLLSNQEDETHISYIFSVPVSSAYGDSLDILNVRVYGDKYYPIKKDDSFYCQASFQNQKIGASVGKTLSIKGLEYKVKETDNFNKTIYKPLDEFEVFKPDFETIAKEYSQLVKELTVHIDVQPLSIDHTYTKHKRYGEAKKFESSLNQEIAKINKLLQSQEDQDQLKQLSRIEKETNLKEKARLYNEFIGNEEYGIEALINKKAFQSVEYKPSYEVPNSLVGTLYTKQNIDYIALLDVSKIDQAKAWLKENHLQAILVKDNG